MKFSERSKRGAGLFFVAVLTMAMLPASSSVAPASAKDIQSASIFSAGKFTAHYVAPRDDAIENILEKEGILLPGSSPAARSGAVRKWREAFIERNPTTPSPEKLQRLLDKERGAVKAATATAAAPTTTPQIMSLAVPVEFPNSDTFDWCTGSPGGGTVTTQGPLHNEIPAPGARDNNTVWYEDATPALYNELYFGVGPKAGVIVQHPILGAVDLRGNTMANYYLEQSEGKFVPKGQIYPKWLQASHSEGWYGADSCNGGDHNVLAGDLVKEVVDAVNKDDASFAWQTYDGDADGVVDNFTVIHAGMGQEAGGGAQGDFSIWSHASAIDYPAGKLACTAGSAGCRDRNIYVREYSMDPENIDIGVISEEFGHAAFGLPDIYTTDAQGSPSNWAIMDAGSWNGKLGGMQPAPFPLFFRYLIGWADPVELDYTTGATSAKVGQLSLRPKGTDQGIKINLPNSVVETPNLAGTGNAWWSGKADLADFYLAHGFDLTAATAPVFSFASYWSFEPDYDYGYVEVSDDGGTTWTKLPDMDSIFVNDGMGNLGLNGEGKGTLSFDLAAYAGKSITLRLHDVSDLGLQWAGWWADDFKLADGATTLFSDDVENPPNGWTTNNFMTVPLTTSYPMYYLAEWRNLSGFDRGLAYPYTMIYRNEATNEWQVDRCPYTAPGMLLWLRNAAQGFDYTLYDSLFDAPSYGPKHALLVVDSHYWPLEWEGMGASGVNLRLSSRCQPGNATFTVQKTTPFTVRRSNVAGDILETKAFERLPAVSQFHDSLGYYPGLRYHLDPDPDMEGLYFWDAAASLAVPAKGDYTTKLTWDDKTPATGLYDIDMGDTVLGSGNPGDAGVQYGLHIAVTDKAHDGSWGMIKVWNSPDLLSLDKRVSDSKAEPGSLLTYTFKVRNLTPAEQPFVLDDILPVGTTFVADRHDDGYDYDRTTNTIRVSDTVPANKTVSVEITVRVDRDAVPGTVITNTATLTDDAVGVLKDSTTTTVVKKHSPHR
jgi:immune inhibitor A